jgi:hypothetical protein
MKAKAKRQRLKAKVGADADRMDRKEQKRDHGGQVQLRPVLRMASYS